MSDLPYPYALHLQAAEGWLELGNPLEAGRELNRIAAPFQSDAEVLKARYEVSAGTRDWDAALQISAALIQHDPEDPLGWVYRSYALHELKRTAEARDNLLRIVNRCPESATIRYNLACYEAQLGRLNQAREWLEAAFKLGNATEMRRAARRDPDLQPLWEQFDGPP